MAQTKISSNAAKNALDSILSPLNSGDSGSIKIYSGVQPANPDTAVTNQVLLAELSLPVPAFGTAVDTGAEATATANTIPPETSVNTTGTASWFRVEDGAGNAIIDGDISESGGGGDMILNSTSLFQNGIVTVTSWVVRFPE